MLPAPFPPPPASVASVHSLLLPAISLPLFVTFCSLSPTLCHRINASPVIVKTHLSSHQNITSDCSKPMPDTLPHIVTFWTNFFFFPSTFPRSNRLPTLSHHLVIHFSSHR